jgi:hypothetical protein
MVFQDPNSSGQNRLLEALVNLASSVDNITALYSAWAPTYHVNLSSLLDIVLPVSQKQPLQ